MTEAQLRLDRIITFRRKLEAGLVDGYRLALYEIHRQDIANICLDLRHVEDQLRKEINHGDAGTH